MRDGMTVLQESTLREAEVLRLALDGLRGDLPRSWKWRAATEARTRNLRFDAIVQLESPDGQEATLLIEAKRSVATRDVVKISKEMRSRAGRTSGAVFVVVARYLAPATRERLSEEGLSYADATGNRPFTSCNRLGATTLP